MPIMKKCSIIEGMAEKKPRLLVVDDEKDQRESFKNYFSRRNFLVFTAISAEEALASIKENKPDLVMLDLKLPEKRMGWMSCARCAAMTRPRKSR